MALVMEPGGIAPVNTNDYVYPTPSFGTRIGNAFQNGWNTLAGWFGGPDSSNNPWGDFLTTQNMTQDQFNALNPALRSQYLNMFNNQQTLAAMDKYAGFGPNLATAKLGFDILGGIGSWVQGNKNLQFAKDQFNWQKDQVAQQNALAWDAYLNRKNSMGRASAAFAGESFTPDDKASVLDRNR